MEITVRKIVRQLIDAGVVALDASTSASLRREAEGELTPFAGRMSRDAHQTAVDAAFRRLVRESLALPSVSFE